MIPTINLVQPIAICTASKSFGLQLPFDGEGGTRCCPVPSIKNPSSSDGGVQTSC